MNSQRKQVKQQQNGLMQSYIASNKQFPFVKVFQQSIYINKDPQKPKPKSIISKQPIKQNVALKQQPTRSIEPKIIREVAKIEQKQQVQQVKVESEDEEQVPQFTMSQSAITPQEKVTATFKQDPIKGLVVVKYSHYKEKFPIEDGILKEKTIDDQYCLSYVFKGNFNFLLRMENDPDRKYLPKLSIGGAWYGVEDGKTYILEVDEDPVQQEFEKANSKPFQTFNPQDLEPPKQNKKVDLITQQLRGMSVEEIQEKGSRYKELIEARDLEDILFK